MATGISLREFTIEDADAVHRWFNSPAATANLLEHRDEFGEEDARRWVERAIEQAGDPDSEDRKWAIEVEGFWETIGVLLIGGTLSIFLATLPIALAQALRALADVGDTVSAR